MSEDKVNVGLTQDEFKKAVNLLEETEAMNSLYPSDYPRYRALASWNAWKELKESINEFKAYNDKHDVKLSLESYLKKTNSFYFVWLSNIIRSKKVSPDKFFESDFTNV